MRGMSAGSVIFVHARFLGTTSVPSPSPKPKLSHCTVQVIAEQVKEETQMMLHPPNKDLHGPFKAQATEDLLMEEPWQGLPWADAEIPTHHPGAQGERDGGQGLFQN